jgi:triacylglycerol lipase
MSWISHWRDRAEMLFPPLPWDRPQLHAGGGATVVLLHGLWRGWHAMEPLARALQKQGFSTLNCPYPSGRMAIDEIALRVRAEIEKISDPQPIHFITHSLGAIVLRAILQTTVPWQTGRIVMLAPPNRGSEIVDWAVGHPPLHKLLGPAGASLGRDAAPHLLPNFSPEIETAVIMGNTSSIPVFRKLLGSENDGIVTAASGRLDHLNGFSIIAADHTFIQIHPETLRLSLHFLKTGEWLAPSSATSSGSD